jgi:hypothetical protein
MTQDQLIHSTIFRRTRRATVRAVHEVDNFISQIGRADVRVLFQASSPLSLAVFRPVMGRLQRDPRFEFWFTSADTAWTADEIFATAGIPGRIVTPAAARWMKFDAYVNADFWNMTWLKRPAKRLHLFHGVAGKYGLDAPLDLAPVVASFDRVLFPNRDRLFRYTRAGLLDAEQAHLVGYPKVDCLVDGSLHRQTLLDSFGLNLKRPTVLYAPTWSPESSLNAVGSRVLETLADLGFNVVVKLHDRSYEQSQRGSGGMNWRARLAMLEASCGLHVAKLTDASPYLFVADLLITDHSSVGFEFMLLDRPIIVVDCPRLIQIARVSLDKVRLLRSAADVITDEARDLPAAVTRALDDPSRLGERRRTIARELFHCPGSATTRAVQCVYDALGLTAPQALHQESPTSAHPFPASAKAHDAAR